MELFVRSVRIVAEDSYQDVSARPLEATSARREIDARIPLVVETMRCAYRNRSSIVRPKCRLKRVVPSARSSPVSSEIRFNR